MAGRKYNSTRHWLIQKRQDSGLTYAEISKRLDVTPQAVFNWERGIRDPKPETAQKLAKILNFDWTKFYEEKDG